MRLEFERTDQCALAGIEPVAIWLTRSLDFLGHGYALIAEVVPVPGGHDIEARRTLLAREMQSKVPPRMHLQPTTDFVSTDGIPARLWHGHTARGQEVFAFVRAIRATNDTMKNLLNIELPSLETNDQAISEEYLLGLVGFDPRGPLR